MNIGTRLAKLERLVGARPVNCPACGAPSAIQIRCVEMENDDEPLPRCGACGSHLDFDGTPLPKHFKVYIDGGH